MPLQLPGHVTLSCDGLYFVLQLEEYLHEEVYDMDCQILMDIATGLFFLNRNPFTLYKHIFSYRFFAQVKGKTVSRVTRKPFFGVFN